MQASYSCLCYQCVTHFFQLIWPLTGGDDEHCGSDVNKLTYGVDMMRERGRERGAGQQ